MKWLPVLITLAGLSSISAQSPSNTVKKPVQPYSGTFWTTTTTPTASGKPQIVTRRAEVTRDAAGNWRREDYASTRGTQHDTTAKLVLVATGTAQSQGQPAVRLLSDKLLSEVDLGSKTFSGQVATGIQRQFRSTDPSIQTTKTEEAWFCPALGFNIHYETHDYSGRSTIIELTDLHLDPPTIVTATKTPVGPIPTDRLYRSLFQLIAHMENARLTSAPDSPPDVVGMEDRLRQKIVITPDQWQTLAAASFRIDQYTKEQMNEAQALAKRDREARKQSSAPPDPATRFTLREMQTSLNARILDDIKKLEDSVGQDGAARIQAYLNGPFAASVQVVHIKAGEAVRQ